MGEIVITSQKYYFGQLISYFLNDFFVSRKANKPGKLGFDHRGQQIMIWVEVPSGDAEMEDKAFLSEAVTNAKFEETGFSISTTVVEENDCLEVQSHYTVIKQ